MPATSSSPLEARSKPVQKRSQERINQILAATGELLASTPTEAITTTLIAERAGIPVSSVYRYFPNVFSIYNALFEQVNADQHEKIISIVENVDAIPKWRERFLAIIQFLRTSIDEHPFHRPLLKAIFAHPELNRPKDTMVNSIATIIAERWRRGEDGFQGADPDIVATMTLRVFLSIEAYLVGENDPAIREKIFDQLVINLESYLSKYLSDERPAGA